MKFAAFIEYNREGFITADIPVLPHECGALVVDVEGTAVGLLMPLTAPRPAAL